MPEQDQLADAAPAVDPEWLRSRADAYGLSDERRAELEEMMSALPWADPELAVERWLQHEADGLHDEEEKDRYRAGHPDEYQWPVHRQRRLLWEMQRKGIVGRAPVTICPRPVARARERRSPRRSIRRASCRARSPGRRPADPEPALARRRGERR
jgi:hypothetical protein